MLKPFLFLALLLAFTLSVSAQPATTASEPAAGVRGGDNFDHEELLRQQMEEHVRQMEEHTLRMEERARQREADMA